MISRIHFRGNKLASKEKRFAPIRRQPIRGASLFGACFISKPYAYLTELAISHLPYGGQCD
jgi:hypothetical protein